MENKNIKKILLEYMPQERYYDICNFVEEIYLMDYDILILMARKFFNLFCIFHELNCQKYKRLDIPYANKGKIVTNRALPLLRSSLKENIKIIVADDVILHGRSLREVYDELLAMCPDAEIKLAAYVRNTEETFVYEDIIDKVWSRYSLKISECRDFSDNIVDSFFAAGRPYISYLPFFKFQKNCEFIKKKLLNMDFTPIQNEDFEKYGIEAYMFTGEKLNIFRKLKSCKIPVIRFYYYSKLDEINVVPYFCMNMIEEKTVKKLSNVIRNNFLNLSYKELAEQNEDADEMRIMELEYVLSAWMGMYFLDFLGIEGGEWNKEIEVYNFYEQLLSKELLAKEAIEENLKIIADADEEIVVIDGSPSERFVNLEREFDKIVMKYDTNYERWKAMTPWNAWQYWKTDNLVMRGTSYGLKHKTESYEQRMFDNYLMVNGNMDEDLCKKRDRNRRHLSGISISYILDSMKTQQDKLYGKEKRNGEYLEKSFAAVISAADSGKGTIIPQRIKGKNHETIIGSVMHAGELKFKFYDETNFPVMYGIYLIELNTDYSDAYKEVLKERKKNWVVQFTDYLEKQNVFYIKEELLQISELNIRENYGQYLQNNYDKYDGNIVFDRAVALAIDICSSECENE